MSFSMLSNSGYHMRKLVMKNLDAYKPIVEKNSSVPLLKTFVKNRVLLLTMGHCTYIKKMG